jgi:hypothetical protein
MQSLEIHRGTWCVATAGREAFARIDAPFVAVPDPHSPAGVQDRLNKAFPKLHRFGEPGYRLVYQNSTWRMFARTNALAIAND